MSYIAEDFREMTPCKEHNFCCGGGGGLNGIGRYRSSATSAQGQAGPDPGHRGQAGHRPCHNCWDAIRDLEEVYEIGIKWSFLKPLLIGMAVVPEHMKPAEEGCRTHAFDRLEFGKTVEMIGFPGKPRLEIYHSLYGAVGTEKVEIRQIPLEELLDMPLGLGRLKHIVFGDRVDVLEFDTVFTLFEFIEGIVWELGFQGTLMACELRR
jgi:hypothetical protein